MDHNKNLSLLADASVQTALFKLGIPTMIGMMVSSLYNLVDTYFVGTLGTSQQAAVSAVFPVSLMMLGVGLFFGCGAGSYLARLLGRGDRQGADQCASTAVGLSVLTAVVLISILLAGLNPLLRLLGCTETMLPYARSYAIPFLLSLILNVFNVTISNLATAEGQTLYSMRSMLLGGGVNMLLDPLFILTFHMGVFGAALATLIAQLISCASYLAFLLQKKSCLHLSRKAIHPTKHLLRELAAIGVPSLAYQVLCSAALSVTNNLAQFYGDTAIAAMGIVSRVFTLGFMIIAGFLKGYQTFVGFHSGAENYQRIRKATRCSLLWTTAFCAIYGMGAILFRVPLIHTFNPDPAVLSIGIRAILPSAITFLTMGAQVVYSTKFMGLGKGLEGGLISLGRQGFFFFPVIYLMTSLWGLTGLIYAQPTADLLSFVLVMVLAAKNAKAETALLTRTTP